MDLAGVPQFIAGGLAVGAVYGLVGAGFSLIYSSSKVINFAQGEFVVLGGLTAFSFATLFGSVWMTAVASLGLMLVIGVLLYLLLRSAKKGSNEFTFVMLTLAVAVALRGSAGLIWGTEYKTYPLYPAGTIKVIGAVVSFGTLWILAVTLLVCFCLWVILYRTMLGKAMRACANNPLAAQTIGVHPQRMVLYSYMGSAFLGALAGILLTPVLMMSYDNGVMLALKGFTAAVAGGLLNPFGAIVGGLLIGVLEGIGVGLVSSVLQDAYPFIVLLLVLLVRPQGIFGRMTSQAGK